MVEVKKTTVSVVGLHLPKVLKNTANMFSKYNIYTGTFDLGMKLYTI
jgi:predicted permease